MEEILTRKLLGPLWREEVSFGKGSFILNTMKYIKGWEKGKKLFLAPFFL